ncbi:MAG TPA: DUF6644 family protein [Alphaproteobacteria bacterium]|nr:DUF6644 family protein [Alphaproteobacteria bacterium]
MSIKLVLEWLENTPLAQAIAESTYLFPLIESIHVLAITFVVGSIAMVDLRLLGVAARDQRPARITADILPWTWGAFIVAAIAGSLLFSSQAEKYFDNGPFRAKFVLMGLAGINMLVFQLFLGRDIQSWPEGAKTPVKAKIAGAISLTLWIGVVTCGRWIGFTMFG